MMQIRRYVDPMQFLDRCQEWLLRDELKNSTMLSVSHLLIQDGHPFDMPFYLATVETGSNIGGCAVRAPPDPLVLSEMPADAIPLLVADIAKVYKTLPTVTGMSSEVENFTRLWEQQCGLASIDETHWRWYAADRVVMPGRTVAGALRLANASDLEMVRDWARRFAHEINTPVDVVGFFERRLETDSLYLWDDGGPRTIVAVSGVTPNSIRLSGVFTTPDSRHQGYASAAVAAVSQRMLDAGIQYCVLFTETSDPSANRLYRNIGYQPIFDKVSVDLAE
jgi:predicted GNAT family acetyltransferase